MGLPIIGGGSAGIYCPTNIHKFINPYWAIGLGVPRMGGAVSGTSTCHSGQGLIKLTHFTSLFQLNWDKPQSKGHVKQEKWCQPVTHVRTLHEAWAIAVLLTTWSIYTTKVVTLCRHLDNVFLSPLYGRGCNLELDSAVWTSLTQIRWVNPNWRG